MVLLSFPTLWREWILFVFEGWGGRVLASQMPSFGRLRRRQNENFFGWFLSRHFNLVRFCNGGSLRSGCVRAGAAEPGAAGYCVEHLFGAARGAGDGELDDGEYGDGALFREFHRIVFERIGEFACGKFVADHDYHSRNPGEFVRAAIFYGDGANESSGGGVLSLCAGG